MKEYHDAYTLDNFHGYILSLKRTFKWIIYIAFKEPGNYDSFALVEHNVPPGAPDKVLL